MRASIEQGAPLAVQSLVPHGQPLSVGVLRFALLKPSCHPGAGIDTEFAVGRESGGTRAPHIPCVPRFPIGAVLIRTGRQRCERDGLPVLIHQKGVAHTMTSRRVGEVVFVLYQSGRRGGTTGAQGRERKDNQQDGVANGGSWQYAVRRQATPPPVSWNRPDRPRPSADRWRRFNHRSLLLCCARCAWRGKGAGRPP